jgi:hypothetical protein
MVTAARGVRRPAKTESAHSVEVEHQHHQTHWLAPDLRDSAIPTDQHPPTTYDWEPPTMTGHSTF